jgi:peptide/nickel transport system ATP-binding protein
MSRPHCDEEEPPLRPVSGVDHVAACHYSEELAGDVAAAEVFETAEADTQAIEQLDQLGDLEEAKAELDRAEADEAEERA